MSDVEWDADEFDPDAAKPAAGTDRWSGEDEDDSTKDNWDDDQTATGGSEGTAPVEVKKKKKKNLQQIIAEKEEKKRKELEERRTQDMEARRKMTPEEMVAEKHRQQKIQEDADLELFKETMGVGNDPLPVGLIDSFDPITKEDFDKFSGLLRDKLTRSQRSTHYVEFLETLFRELTLELEAEEIKILNSSMTALYNEKNKVQKKAKGNKKVKGAKVSLNAGKEDNYDDYTTGAIDDYDDFI